MATGEPEPDPESILESEEFVDWQDMKKHLAEPDLEKVSDTTPGEDAGYQTPSTTSDTPEATSTAAHDEL